MLSRRVFEGAHRVVVRGLALRFFLRTDDTWSPVTDTDFQHAYELALFDPDALGKDVLYPNRAPGRTQHGRGLVLVQWQGHVRAVHLR